MSAPPRHLEGEELRRLGHQLVDWIVDYRTRIPSLPVLSSADPGAVRAQLPPHPPEHGDGLEGLLDDLDRIIVPGLTHWQSPSFFAYFPSNASGPSVLGELLSAGLGVQGMLWATSPACTELEEHVLDWLVELLGLPESWSSRGPGGGVIQDTASTAVLCALLAARERATGGRAGREGVRAPLVVYATAETHSSVEKAVRIAGIGTENLRRIEVDEELAMRPQALAEAMAADRAAGRMPCIVVATVGTTSTTAVDPVAQIAELCHAEGVWLHVDAAFAGSAAICPEMRPAFAGSALADSWSFNPHKWLLTAFDCSVLWVADRASLVGALSILPEYLKNAATASGAVTDYRDWQVQLGRRFRALKLWLVIRWYGAEGLRAHIRHHLELARAFESWVAADPEWEVATPTPFSLVCFRHRGGEALNQRILDRCNQSGELYLTHTRVRGQLTLRLAIGSVTTERRHVEAAWQALRSAAASAGARAPRLE